MKNAIRFFIYLAVVLIAGAVFGNAQTTDCPLDKVCMTVGQARQALVDSDTVKAQVAEIATLKLALADQKNITADIKIELAKAIGEKTGAEQMVVRLTAIIEFLQKNGRKKCGTFTLICVQ